MATRIEGDMDIVGHLTASTFTVPNSSVTNAAVASNAAIDSDKLQHLFKLGTNFDLAIGGTPVAREEIVYVCSASGGAIVRAFKGLLNDTGTSTDVTYDLKKNGTTILSATINITHADSDRQVKSGTLSSTALAQGDVLSISLAVVASTGAQGPYAWVEIDELAP